MLLFTLWNLVKGHASGLDAILDMEVKGLSALGMFMSLQLKSCEPRKHKFLLMCPGETKCIITVSTCLLFL